MSDHLRGVLIPCTILTALTLIAGCTRRAAPPPPAADTVFLHGKAYTVDPAAPWAEAIAVKGDSIMFVGSDRDAERYIGRGTQTIDLEHHLTLPGFIDSHFHLPMGAALLDSVDLSEAATLDVIQQKIQTYAAAHPGESWIQGRGWFYAALPGGRPPTRQDIDRVEARRPVYLACYDGHSAWANSRALALAGITRRTPNPANGLIVKDPRTGEPTGMLKEEARALVVGAMPVLTPGDKRALLTRAFQLIASNGITSIQNAHGTLEELRLYDELNRAGKVTAHVYTALSAEAPSDAMGQAGAAGGDPAFPTFGDPFIQKVVELKSVYRGPMVKAGAVKIVADGVIEANTASMLEPYTNAPTTSGLPNYTPEVLARMVAALDRAQIQVLTHAIGDRAVRITLDAYEAAIKANGARDRRFRIEHIETHQPSDTPRFAELGILALMQPFHANPSDNETVVWAGNIGPERASRAWAWHSLRMAGARLAFGSDWPVVDMNPFIGMHSAINRQTSDGKPPGGWLPEQRLGVEDTIAAYTINGAYASFDDEHTGSLEPGKWADIVVVRDDLFTMPRDRIFANKVLLTMTAGQIVYRTAF